MGSLSARSVNWGSALIQTLIWSIRKHVFSKNILCGLWGQQKKAFSHVHFHGFVSLKVIRVFFCGIPLLIPLWLSIGAKVFAIILILVMSRLCDHKNWSNQKFSFHFDEWSVPSVVAWPITSPYYLKFCDTNRVLSKTHSSIISWV